MDAELARTFLTIVEAGSFVRAAERLNVTQSTVSMRIKELERRLGRPLFVRSRAGASMTVAGIRFRRHAEALLQAWRQARQEIALPPEFRAVLAVGGQYSLWNRLLLQWIGWMRAAAPDVALRAEVAQPEALTRQLSEGTLDLGVMYSPESRPGLAVEKLVDDTLVLVSTDAEQTDIANQGYVYIDWGPEFEAAHSLFFPNMHTPALFVWLGELGLQHILARGGSGYLPLRVVRPLVAAGRLHVIAAAPEFSRPAYAVYRDADRGELAMPLAGLREIAAAA